MTAIIEASMQPKKTPVIVVKKRR
ncbi:TPA: ProQ/FINO family protein, partial [Klebsiella pneumoniae]